jgi:hypothetical protein
MSLSVVDTSVGNGYGFKSEMSISSVVPCLGLFIWGRDQRIPQKNSLHCIQVTNKTARVQEFSVKDYLHLL